MRKALLTISKWPKHGTKYDAEIVGQISRRTNKVRNIRKAQTYSRTLILRLLNICEQHIFLTFQFFSYLQKNYLHPTSHFSNAISLFGKAGFYKCHWTVLKDCHLIWRSWVFEVFINLTVLWGSYFFWKSWFVEVFIIG